MRKAGTSPAFSWVVGRTPSEFVTKHELDLSGTIDNAVTAPARNSEVLISRPPIDATERVSVESVWDIRFEEDILTLANACSLNDRKVFVHVSRTSPPGDSSRQISKPIRRDGTVRVRIHIAGILKGPAVGRLRSGSNVRGKNAIRLSAATIPTGVKRRRPVGRVRGKDSLTWH